MITSKELVFSAENDTNGLVYWLGSLGETDVFSPPIESGKRQDLIKVDTSSLLLQGTSGREALYRSGYTVHTQDLTDEWVIYTLPDGLSMTLTHFSIRNRIDDNVHLLVNFSIEASIDNVSWDVIAINSSGVGMSEWFQFILTTSALKYKYIKILRTGVNSSGGNHLAYSDIEFYGSLQYESSITGLMDENNTTLYSKINVSNYNTGELIKSVDVPAGVLEYAVVIPELEMGPVSISRIRKYGESRVSGTDYILGDTVLPYDTTIIPYYFKCIQAGTSGYDNNIWLSVVGQSFTDGTIVWECAGEITAPLIQAPVGIDKV